MGMSLSQNNKFYFYLSLSAAWFLLIIYLMVFYRAKASSLSFSYSDKLIHFILFFVQSFLITKSYFLKNKILNLSVFKILVPFIFFCIIIEVAQIFIPYRNFELFDLLTNIFGSILGSIIGYFFSK